MYDIVLLPEPGGPTDVTISDVMITDHDGAVNGIYFDTVCERDVGRYTSQLNCHMVLFNRISGSTIAKLKEQPPGFVLDPTCPSGE